MSHPKAYTLVEILVATTLSLVMMVGVMEVFATISRNMNDSRAIVEAQGRLRQTASLLSSDLGGATASVLMTPLSPPPGDPIKNAGYLEYVEGPIGPLVDPETVFIDSTNGGIADTTVGDVNDYLMLTVKRPANNPFIGRCGFKRKPVQGETPFPSDGNSPYVIDTYPVTSQYAEVIWFVRGRTLHRRVLLIVPGYQNNYIVDMRNGQTPAAIGSAWAAGFYGHSDISVRLDITNQLNGTLGVVANTLSDLTNRENRFAHGMNLVLWPITTPSAPASGTDFPFDTRRWGQLSLPTLRECAYFNPNVSTANKTWTKSGQTWSAPSGTPWSWYAGGMSPNPAVLQFALPTWQSQFDLWASPNSWTVAGTLGCDSDTGDLSSCVYTGVNDVGARVAEDVILDNCIGFDVKVWDPNAPMVYDAPTRTVVAPGDRSAPYPNGRPYYQVLADSTSTRVSYGAFADLNFMCRLGPSVANSNLPAYYDLVNAGTVPEPYFYGAGNAASWLRGAAPTGSPNGLAWPACASVYDTGSISYQKDGIGAPPPYAKPLQAIQIKIRIMEPDSKQIREQTVVQKFW